MLLRAFTTTCCLSFMAAVAFVLPQDAAAQVGDCYQCGYVELEPGVSYWGCQGANTGSEQCSQPEPGRCDLYGATCEACEEEECEEGLGMDGSLITSRSRFASIEDRSKKDGDSRLVFRTGNRSTVARSCDGAILQRRYSISERQRIVSATRTLSI